MSEANAVTLVPAIFYGRCSGLDEESTRSQLRRCIDVAREHGHEIVTDPRFVYVDDNVSGAIRDRGGLGRLEADVKAGRVGRNGRELKVEHLWIREQERLWRGDDPRFPIAFEYNLLRDAGITVHYSDETDQPDYSEGFTERHGTHFISRSVHAMHGFRERAQIRKKTRERKREMIMERCYPCKSVPYGVERILIDERTREFVRAIKPGERIQIKGTKQFIRYARDRSRRFVKWIFLSIAAGRSLRAICADLERRGIPSPGGGTNWHPSRITWILRNPIYKGTLLWGAEKGIAVGKRRKLPAPVLYSESQAKSRAPILYPGFLDEPALISEELWDKAQQVLAGNHTLWERRRTTKPKYLLTGKIRCAECGALMCGAKQVRRGRLYRYYRHLANTQPEQKNCSGYGKAVRAEAVELPVTGRVRQLLASDDLPALVQHHVRRMQNDDHSVGRRRKLEELEKEESELIGSHAYAVQEEVAASGSRKEELKKVAERLSQQLDAVRQDLEALRGEEVRLRDVESRPLISADAEALVKMLDDTSFSRQRAVIERIVQEVRYHREEGKIDLVLCLSGGLEPDFQSRPVG